MNLLRAGEFKVGILVLSVSALIAYMSMQVGEDPTFFGRANEAWFVIPDAGGLVKNSAVKTAGIPIGVIKDIRLQDGMARIDLTMKPDIQLYTSASVEIRTQGILGDKYINVLAGSPTDPPLARGAQIMNIRDKGSLEGVVTQITDIGASLKDTAQILQDAVANDGNRQHVLGRIVLNIEKLTADLTDMTTANREKVNDIVDNVRNVTNTLDELLNDPSAEGFKSRFKDSMAKLDSSLKNIDEITGKINRGEGTIGKLINDGETAEELDTAIQGVNNLLDTAGKLQTGIDFQSYYLGQAGAARTSVNIKIQPGLDRYYLIGVVDDPFGVVEGIDTTTTSGGTTTEVSEKKVRKNEFKFNAQFAKSFYNFTVRGGIIENSGGVGFDYLLFRERAKLSLDAFQFSQLNLRAQLQYSLYKGIYLVGGADDMLSRSGKSSGYLGAGLFLTNDDLRLLLSSVPR
jgi:phospholipid/cholesterol/gamma-HCH transport system substrate-binding protein